MRIQHNIAALNSYRNLMGNNTAVGKNLEKLSSGYRINRAGDDAAGLAISEKMRSQIKGLETAVKNSNDAISLVQTAEGALTEVHSMMNRMVELATQSANGIYDDAVDRAALQDEMDSLTTEIDRIADSTNFNKKNLLDGTLSSYGKATASGASVENIKSIKTGEAGGAAPVDLTNKVTVGDKVDQGSSSAGTFSLDFSGLTDEEIAGLTEVKIGNKTLTIGEGKDIVLDGNKDGKELATKIKEKLAEDTGEGAIFDSMTYNAGASAETEFKITDDTNGKLTFESGDGTSSNPADWSTTPPDFKLTGTDTAGAGGDAGALRLQIGDTNEEFNHIDVEVVDMHTLALGIASVDETGDDGVSIATQGDAGKAIDKINTAINTVSSQRGKLGALQNRLEHTINNLNVNVENMTAAESRIRDVDMAKEMMSYTKNNILVQASQAMLAQANQVPQGVLQLLQ